MDCERQRQLDNVPSDMCCWNNYTESVMAKCRERFKDSGLTYEDLGIRMGYAKKSAKKSAWQFLKYTDDPRLSMLTKFADALGEDISNFV